MIENNKIDLYTTTLSKNSESQSQKTVSTFHNEIRRKYLNSYFTQIRHRVIDQQEKKKQEQIRERYNLEDSEVRNNYVEQIAKNLSGEIQYFKWKQNLSNLLNIIKICEKQHHLWIQYGILKSITSLFVRQKAQLQIQRNQFEDLTRIGANILVDIVNSNASNHPQIIDSIMKYNFIDSFVQNYIFQQANNREVRIQYMRLLGGLIANVPAYRQYFYSKKCLSFAFFKLKNFQNSMNSRNSEQVYICYVMIYSFIKYNQMFEQYSKSPKKCIVLEIIQFLGEQFMKFDSFSDRMYQNRIIILILRSFTEVCRLNKNELYTLVIKKQRMIMKVIDMLCSQGKQVMRVESGKLISQILMSQNPEHTSALFDYGLVAKILQVYRNIPKTQAQLYYLLRMLANITADDPAFQSSVFQHPIFGQMILQQAKNSPFQNTVRKEAIYCICNIIRNMGKAQANLILDHMKIFQILIQCVQRKDSDIEMVSDILNTWIDMVEKCEEDQQNPYYFALVTYYDIENMLLNNEREQLDESIGKFLDYLNNFQSK